jgi:hypothetical protein
MSDIDRAMYPRIAGPDRYRAAREASLRPDPRISTKRPGWLADDQAWHDQLQALDLDQISWIEHQWELAGGTELIGGRRPAWVQRLVDGDSVLIPIASFVLVASAGLAFLLLCIGGGK